MDKELHILWSSANIITAETAVFMYAVASIRQKWWDKVTIILWGASVQLANRNPKIQLLIKDAISNGVHVSACTACADMVGSTDTLNKIGVELKYWGQPMTELLQQNKKLLNF